MTIGRPRIRPRPLDDGIVDRIAEGLASGLGIRKVCEPEDMPTYQSVYVEMAKGGDFAKAIARAREAQQEHEADACVEMADEANEGNWQVVKLRIWARQWRAAKLAPKKYGEKVQQEITGKDGGPIETKGDEALTIETARKIAFLLETGRRAMEGK
jgi:hypothetical protein